MPFSVRLMSTISVRSEGATYSFLNGLHYVNDPVVVDDRPVVGDEGGIVVLIDDACLRESELRAREKYAEQTYHSLRIS